MIEEINRIELDNGALYSGDAEYDGCCYIPNGLGGCVFPDHSEVGLYKQGKMQGFGYFHYGRWFETGTVKDGRLHGWAFKNNYGKLEFGIFKNGELEVDFTDLGSPIIDKIKEDCMQYNVSPVKTYRDPYELFVGIGQYGSGITKRFGFHFFESGDVYAGTTDIDCKRKLTGHFFHFDRNCEKITLGYYEDGVLVHEIEKDTFLNSKEDFWGTYEFFDFNINRPFI